MLALLKRGAEIFRDYATDGVPASGAHEPVKADIREWMLAIETPLIGRAWGTLNAQKTVTDNTPKRFVPNAVLFDTDPNRVAATTSGLIEITGGGSDVPTGKLNLTREGFYELKCKLYWGSAAPSGMSFYMRLMKEVGGVFDGQFDTVNVLMPSGTHPSLMISQIVEVDEPLTKFYVEVYYIATTPGSPATHDLATGVNFCWLEAKYLGPPPV